MLFLPEPRTALSIRAPITPHANAEAIAWFRHRTPLPASQWRALDERARRRSTTAAGVTGLDVAALVWRALDRAIASGTNFTQFKREIGDSLRNAWAGTDPSRLNNLFRTNVQEAYSSGRYAQMTNPDVLSDRPVWRFEAILDSRTSHICQPLDGVTLPANDAFWRDHIPPLHFACRSGITSLAADEIDRYTSAPEDARAAQSGFGAAPDVSEWAPSESDYPPSLWGAYTRWRANQSNE